MAPPKRKNRQRLVAALLLALVPGLLGIALTYWPPAASLEHRGGLDNLFMMRGTLPQPQGVAVVALDDISMIELEIDPLALAWPREEQARFVTALEQAGARAIAFDVIFETEVDARTDQLFVDAIRDADNVVLGSKVELVRDPKFNLMRLVDPYGPFAEAAKVVGEVGLPTESDGVIRKTWLMRDDRPSLALGAYEVATGDTSPRSKPHHWIDFYGPPRTIPTVSAWQVVTPGALAEDFFQDRIVFVGLSQDTAATDVAKDSFPTPFRGQTTYGVEIHATIAAILLEGRQIRLLPRWLEWTLLLMLPLVASVVFLYLRPIYGGLALVVLLVLPWVVAFLAFGRGYWIPVVLPTAVQLPLAYLISILWYYLTTVRDRERIRRAFSFYLSPAMTSKIADDPDSLNLGGTEIVATALFSDIAGFTSIAEKQTAPDTAAMLNEYFSEITRQIFETDGTLIKYIGDAVFAIWGAPIYMDDHATRACRTALAMARAREQLAGTSAGQLITRIGVHTGPMLVGNLGSDQRFDYTAIGDAVNLAARLEGLNKAFGTITLASGDSFGKTDGSVFGRPMGRAQVVGRSEPVEIVELLALDGEPVPVEAEVLQFFGDALASYQAGELDVAERGFRQALERSLGTDGPSRFYLGELDRLASRQAPEGWDGTIAFTKK